MAILEAEVSLGGEGGSLSTKLVILTASANNCSGRSHLIAGRSTLRDLESGRYHQPGLGQPASSCDMNSK
jgi:hypothetical protein